MLTTMLMMAAFQAIEITVPTVDLQTMVCESDEIHPEWPPAGTPIVIRGDQIHEYIDQNGEVFRRSMISGTIDFGSMKSIYTNSLELLPELGFRSDSMPEYGSMIEGWGIEGLQTSTSRVLAFGYFKPENRGGLYSCDASYATGQWTIEDLIIGDSNRDDVFDSSDLVTVFQAGQYEDGIEDNSRWEHGDWDFDRDFNTGDLVFAFQQGAYEQPPAASAIPEPSSIVMALLSVVLTIRNFRSSRP